MIDQDEIKPGYLTSVEVADMLGVSCRTLHRWHRLRKGPPQIKIGRHIFYRSQAVQAWLLALEVGTSGQHVQPVARGSRR